MEIELFEDSGYFGDGENSKFWDLLGENPQKTPNIGVGMGYSSIVGSKPLLQLFGGNWNVVSVFRAVWA